MWGRCVDVMPESGHGPRRWGQLFRLSKNFMAMPFGTPGSVNLNGAVIPASNFSGMTLENVDFYGANLGGANFSGAILKNVDFTKANLDNANLTNATVVGGSWFRATCIGAQVAGLTFSGTNLERTFPQLS